MINLRLHHIKLISISFLVVILLLMSVPAKGFGTINVWTDRPVYYQGELVQVSFDALGGAVPATVTIDVFGPVSFTWGPTNIITGAFYTATLTGATFLPGYYTVTVTLGLEFDIYEGSTSYTVLPVNVVTEHTTTTRTKTKTEIYTSYTYTTKSLTRSSIVTVTDTATKIGKTISTTMTLTGVITVTEYSPTSKTTLTVTIPTTQHLSTVSPILLAALLLTEFLHLQRSSSKDK